MASRDDTSDAASGGERLRHQKSASASSRRGRGASRRASAPDVQRGRGRASTTAARASKSSEKTNRPRRPASTTSATAGKRATRLRESGRPRPARKTGKGPIGGAPPGNERRRAPTPSYGVLTALWRSLLASLRRLQRKLKRALATPQARRILTALLAHRLPGPLRVLVEGLGDPDQRGFVFWWLVITLVMTLAIGLLLSIALAPLVGIVALVGVGVWMLVQGGRRPAAQ